MSELLRYSDEKISLEVNRDLRDYALVNGFHYAKKFVTELKRQLHQGDTLLDMGSGNGKAISQAGRQLVHEGIRCIALDTEQPKKKYGFVDYLTRPFSDTQLKDGSVQMILSVCRLFTYAENKDELDQHIEEIDRILADNGKLMVVVKPVIRLRNYEEKTTQLTTLVELSNRLKKLNHKADPEELRAINEQLRTMNATEKFEHNLEQQDTEEIWIQSPSNSEDYFIINIYEALEKAGFTVDRRIIPVGGMMIKDEITLHISKG
jgi:ubiquinone/menaquinone biosynthesis C-methylase UbiE